MKRTLFLAAMILSLDPLTDPVHAAGRDSTYCSSTGIADGGYELELAPDLRTAVLAEQSFFGPRNHINMVCQALPVRRFPDALNNYLLCKDPRDSKGAGMIVRVFSGGIAGVHYASVRHSNTLGQETEMDFGNLNCRR